MTFMPKAVRVTLASKSGLPAPIACAAKMEAAIEMDSAGNWI